MLWLKVNGRLFRHLRFPPQVTMIPRIIFRGLESNRCVKKKLIVWCTSKQRWCHSARSFGQQRTDCHKYLHLPAPCQVARPSSAINAKDSDRPDLGIQAILSENEDKNTCMILVEVSKHAAIRNSEHFTNTSFFTNQISMLGVYGIQMVDFYARPVIFKHLLPSISQSRPKHWRKSSTHPPRCIGNLWTLHNLYFMHIWCIWPIWCLLSARIGNQLPSWWILTLLDSCRILRETYGMPRAISLIWY